MNQVKREYNGLGQLTSEWQEHDGAVTGSSLRVQYGYSFAPSGTTNHSRPNEIIYPNTKSVVWSYGTGVGERTSRVASVSVNTITVEGYSYLGLDTVVQRTHSGPGVNLTYVKPLAGDPNGDAGDKYVGLDRFGRVVDQRWRSGSELDRHQYAYDADSNRTAATNPVNTAFSETYGYDNLNQLTSYSRGTTSKAWDYDAVGNWDGVTTNGTTEGRTHNNQNEIGSATGQTTPTYDANGNQTTDFAGRTFTYDAWNRTKSAAGRTYELDGLGRRIKTVVGPDTTDSYYTAAWQVVEERVNGVVRAHYVWSPHYVDELILRDRDANNNSADGLEQRLWAAQDANYNVTALFNGSGTVVERYAYDPYGAATVYDAGYTVRASSSYAWDRLHQGLAWDAITGKYYARNRDYDPAEGRWMQEDPVEFSAGDVDLYRYVSDSPQSIVDPSGLIEWRTDGIWSAGAQKILSDCQPVTDAIANAARDAKKYQAILTTIPVGACEAPNAADEKFRRQFVERVRKWFVDKRNKNHWPTILLTAEIVAEKVVKLDTHYSVMGYLRFTWTWFADIAQVRTRSESNTIYVNERGMFFTTSDKNRRGIIIHELTHLLINTQDHAYIASVNDPDQYDGPFRTSNADNYQYWFEDYYL